MSRTMRMATISWRVRPTLPMAAALLTASILLGGGTRPGFLGDAILQMLTLPALFTIAWYWPSRPRNRAATSALLGCALILTVPLLQLIPLPPELWQKLPMRDQLSAVHDLMGQPPGWAPLSVAPHMTTLAALSLAPPIALFLLVLLCDATERRALSLCLLGIGVVSVALGLLQLAQGPFSPLRFFSVTNPFDAVGFFANRNHFAALIYCLLPLAAAWMPLRSGALDDRHRIPAHVTVAIVAALFAIFLAGQAMARSRAGLLLTLPSIAGCIAIAAPTFTRQRHDQASRRLFVGALAVMGLFIVQFAYYRVIDRFTADPLSDGRISFGRNTLQAAESYFPFGSGVGTFTTVYPQFPRITDENLDTFANRAHNDGLEALMESGVIAIVVLALFLVWYARRLNSVWWLSRKGEANRDLRLAQAGSIMVALLLMHSLLDYPLRTGAIMAVAAFACALLIPPAPRTPRTTAGMDRHALSREHGVTQTAAR